MRTLGVPILKYSPLYMISCFSSSKNRVEVICFTDIGSSRERGKVSVLFTITVFPFLRTKSNTKPAEDRKNIRAKIVAIKFEFR